jgi:hypothetical protein
MVSEVALNHPEFLADVISKPAKAGHVSHLHLRVPVAGKGGAVSSE